MEIIPVIVIGLRIITARVKYIGPTYRNRWWENSAIGFLFLLGCIGTYFALSKVMEKIQAFIH